MKILDKKALFTLLIIPIELLLGNFVVYPAFANQADLLGIIMILIFIFGFLVAIFLNKNFLGEEWAKFKNKFWLKLIISFGLMFVAQGILILTRSLISFDSVDNNKSLAVWVSLLPSLWGMIPTLLAPFVEEIVFRHYLFMKFKNVNRVVFWGLWLIQSVLFGLVHWSNFHGDIIQMIPYMVIGAFFGLVYYFSKNIWQSIFTHFLFNSVATFSIIMSIITLILSGQ